MSYCSSCKYYHTPAYLKKKRIDVSEYRVEKKPGTTWSDERIKEHVMDLGSGQYDRACTKYEFFFCNDNDRTSCRDYDDGY